MRWLLLIVALAPDAVRADERPASSVREKLRGKLAESFPLAVKPSAGDQVEPNHELLVLEPIVISESRGVIELERLVAKESQREKAAKFSFVTGGRLYRSEWLELGTWWDPRTGWTFF